MTRASSAEARRTFHVHFTDERGEEQVRDFPPFEADNALMFASRHPGSVVRFRQDGEPAGEMRRADARSPWVITQVHPAEP